MDGFLKNPSFKIAMSRRACVRWAGVGRCPRFTFLLTFFQSFLLPLFFNGLLSYLVGMKRRTSRCFTCKRDNSSFLCYLKSPSIMLLGVFLVCWKKCLIRAVRLCRCTGWFESLLGTSLWEYVFSYCFSHFLYICPTWVSIDDLGIQNSVYVGLFICPCPDIHPSIYPRVHPSDHPIWSLQTVKL